ncbi:heavy metal-binding domain-containing protein [Elioraea rosea]|uniref:heavy metal-binding domain-containing protein n=1 Tax=Elioraea rosea TaxID=2492390 RepID=UPI001182198C|nr:heavy metal-binding domain-containing protein [Elioraea rosea]
MIFTTTNSVAGREITAYLGIVFGDAVVGVNVVRDVFASIRDIVGGRSAAYEKELSAARRVALENLLAEARELGADAVVGVDIDYASIGKGGGMLMVTTTGTAVKLAPAA